MIERTSLEEEILEELELFRKKLDAHLTRSDEDDGKEWKRFQLRQGVYGQRQDDVYMLRIRVAFGRLNSNQLRQLAYIIENYSDRPSSEIDAGMLGHITTRQAIQIHFAKLEEVPEIQRLLAEVGLTGNGACGDAVRNIVAPSLAGVDPSHPFDITPYAEWLEGHVLRNPELADVPRKFKIAFAGSSEERSQTLINDIGYEACFNEKGERGFRVFLGGGLGIPPTLAKKLRSFLPENQVLAITRAILEVFTEFTERKNRKKMRFKILIEKHGWDQVVTWIEERIGKYLERRELRELPKRGPDFPPAKTEINFGEFREISDQRFQKWLKISVHPQVQEGLAALRVRTDRGDLDPDQWMALADFADQWGEGEVRTDRDQNVVVPHVAIENLYAAFTHLDLRNLLHIPSGGFIDPVSCPGGDTCNLAVTKSRSLAKRLENAMSAWAPYADSNTSLRISGCPNSCGQHMTATIGFWGTAKKVHGKLMPCYELMLGGGDDGKGNIQLAKMIGRIPSRAVPDVLDVLLQLYLEQREEGESIPFFFSRSKKQEIQELLEPFSQFEELGNSNPTFFKEFFTESSFSIRR